MELFGTIILGCLAAIAVITTGVFIYAAGKTIKDMNRKNKSL
jgi:hypothetical protein